MSRISRRYSYVYLAIFRLTAWSVSNNTSHLIFYGARRPVPFHGQVHIAVRGRYFFGLMQDGSKVFRLVHLQRGAALHLPLRVGSDHAHFSVVVSANVGDFEVVDSVVPETESEKYILADPYLTGARNFISIISKILSKE